MDANEMRMIAEKAGRVEYEKKAYEYFDKKIKEAAERGMRRIFFSFNGGYVDPDTNKWVGGNITHITREDGKEHYRKLGFTFEYVGQIGGVWQARDQENIVW